MSPFLTTALDAARRAGQLLRDHYESDALGVDELLDHDVKLALDVQSQELISDVLLSAHPTHAVWGEEGIAGDQSSDCRWIVDPIDGTVNYFFGIPHFCISIGLQEGDEITHGIVYDPLRDEMFAVGPGTPASLNGKPIHVSRRETLAEAVVTVGFSKTKESMEAGIERFKRIAFKVRKTRMLGSAALGMAYIACGRLDAYIEESVSLWDIAAGELLIKSAGGSVRRIDRGVPEKFGVVSWNGKIPLDRMD